MTNEEYNGWVNRETWAMALHLSNDYGLYTHLQHMKDCVERNVMKYGSTSESWTDRQCVKFTFEDELKEYIETMVSPLHWSQMGSKMPELWCYMAEDVGSLWRVNWRDVANSFFDDE